MREEEEQFELATDVVAQYFAKDRANSGGIYCGCCWNRGHGLGRDDR